MQPLAAFVDACRRRRTGWLEIDERPDRRHRIGLCNGAPVALELAAEVAPLPAVLRRWDDIDEALLGVLASAALPQDELKRELLAARIVTRSRLAEAERLQVLERLRYLLALPTCPVALHSATANEELARARALVFLPHAYLHLARDTAARETVEGYVARFQDRPLALAPDLDLQGLGLTPEESEVAWRLAVEPRSRDDLLAEGFAHDSVNAVIFTLALTKGLRLRPPSIPVRATVPPRVELPTASVPESCPSGIRRRRPTPASTFEQAEREMDRGNLLAAGTAVAIALDQEPDNPSLHAMQAFLSAQRAWQEREEAAPQRDAIHRLDGILDAARDCALAHHYRGLLHRRLGQAERARQDQQAASRLNPYHAATQRELKALEQSPDPEPTKPRWYERLLRRA